MKAVEETNQLHYDFTPTRYTPRQLIMHHIENPNVPIKAKDIADLVLDLSGVNGWLDENRIYKNDNKFSYS